MIRKRYDSFMFHAVQIYFTVKLNFDEEDGVGKPPKSTGHAGLPSVSFEGPLAILRAISPRAPF